MTRSNIWRVRRPAVLRWLAAASVAVLPGPVRAQVPANEAWFTIRTPHFRVHFTREEEGVGRRAAAAAERAYANLSSELVPPRGIIDVVVTDAADGSNGAAGVFPRNHIVVQARPPVDQTSLENYDDWMTLVMQHEVTHIFHLDRSRGWWRAAQRFFGRNPVLFPNNYSPSWLAEGLAVYYESRFTSGGRLEGTYQYAVARAAALEQEIPRLSELSLVTSRYPYGQAAYIYGAFVVDEMSRAHGPASVRRFIETSSAMPVPFLLDLTAKQAFGETFTRAWRRWRDSVMRDTSPSSLPAGWHVVPHGGRYIIHPRWRSDTSVIYFADDGRETPGVYIASLPGAVRRVVRTTSLDAGAVRKDGTIVFSQGEFLDRFHMRNDLYEYRPDGSTRRLTVGQRLSAPDVRPDGVIVAVQTLPGTTRLVLVSPDGRTVTAMTGAAADTQWTDPRWSPNGAAVAAIRIAHGTSEVVVLDTTGRVVWTAARSPAVTRSPSWGPGGNEVFFTSDLGGVPEVYSAPLATGEPPEAPALSRRAAWPTGLYDVDVHRDSGAPDVRVPGAPMLLSTTLRLDGLHVVTTRPDTGRNIARPDSTATPVSYARSRAVLPPVLSPDSGRAEPYSPWATLPPAYWSPLLSSGSQYGTLLGAVTSGEDVIGRHSYLAQALMNTSTHHVDALATYRYSRFINPIFDLSAEQSWSYAGVYGSAPAGIVGRLDRRIQLYSLRATFARQRVFNYSAVVLGTEFEARDYVTVPDTLLPRLSTFNQHAHRYPTLLTAVQFSNVQRPTLSISPEDGVAVTLTGRQRWESGAINSGVPSAVLVTQLYKSLDLPGFAHHVIALRATGAATNNRSPGEYSAGGVSGGLLEIVPGITIGDQERTFPVRGFPAGTEQGIRAFSTSLEYRAPLTLPSQGLSLLPVFLDRTSLTLFADAGKAYCPANARAPGTSVAGPACGALDVGNPLLTSIGGELNIDSALQFDVPYRFRFGVAIPLQGRSQFQVRPLSTYVTLGSSF